jgi:hypothetical protein
MLRLLIYLLLALPCTTNAQFVEWVNTYNGNNEEYPKAIATDKDGNVYTIGEFSSVVDFDPTPAEVILRPGGVSGTFITKMDKRGKLIWAKALNGRAVANQIALDKLGNVYFTGYYEGQVDFDPGATEYKLYSELSIFLCKLNTFGEFKWVKSIGGINGTGTGSSLCVDSAFNIYTTGRYIGTISLPSSTGELKLIGGSKYNVYIAKLDTTGNFIWAKSLQTTGASNSSNQIITDNSGNTYTIGYFDQTTDFNPDSSVWNEESNGNADAFILKLDKDGTFIWVKKFGGINNEDGRSVSLDKNNMLYAIGSFASTVTMAATTLISKGDNDVFVLKLDTAGQLVWAKAIGGIGYEEGASIHADLNGNVYLAGAFSYTVDFDPGDLTNNVTTLDGFDAFVCKLNADGVFDWVRTIGGKGGFEWANSVTTDLNGSIYAMGAYEDTAFYDKEQPTKSLVSSGSTDVFIIKYSPINTGINTYENSISPIKIYPNPSNGLIYMEGLKSDYPVDIVITDAIGLNVYSAKTKGNLYLDLTSLQPGTYFINFKNSQINFNQKFIIIE